MTCRAPHLMLAAALVASITPLASAEILDRSGAPVPATSTASPSAQLVGSPTLAATLFGPFTANANTSVASPEDDLQRALDDIVATGSATTAENARVRAIAILEGTALGDRGGTYGGIGLLNHGLAKTKTLGVGDTVDVKVVRFGQHVVSDTWLIEGIPQNTTWKIRYRTMQLGGDTNGMFNPAPLLSDQGLPIGGLHSVLSQLSPTDDVSLAAQTVTSRFTQVTNPGTPAQPLASRALVEERVVTMPPGRYTSYVLEPNLRVDHESLATFVPHTAARAGVSTSIADLATIAPEKQIWTGLTDFGAIAAGSLAAAKTMATGLRQQVATMRVRNQLPPGVTATPGVDVDVAFVNNETYVSTPWVAVPTARAITVRIQNHDLIPHTVKALALTNRQQVYGALDWGRFDWGDLALDGPATLAPGQAATYTLGVPASAFSLVVGDPERGSQAMHQITLDRGPKMDAFTFPGSTDRPLHQAFDASGKLWVTIPAADTIARVTPATDLAQSSLEHFLIPGGVRKLQPPGGSIPFAPTDIAVDQRGKVWVTAPGRNAIVRLDPALVEDGTENGMTVYPLNPCAPGECRVPVGLPPVGPLSRSPLQIEVHEDAAGNAVVWFTEMDAKAIGMLRVSPTGQLLSKTDIDCGCTIPLGIEVDASGDVWFTETLENRIGRLRPSRSRPFTGAPVITHYLVPSALIVTEPDLGIFNLPTSIPHSLKFGPDGRLWFTELVTHKLAVLDPALAVPGTIQGITEIPLQKNDFGAEAQPADLFVDRGGLAFVTDEYGDAIRTASSAGPGVMWRTEARQSLTDEPLVDNQGNLYVIEAAAGLMVRYRGVGTPTALVPTLGRVTVETHTDAVAITGLTDAVRARVEVLRGGVVVSRGETALTAGVGRVGTGGAAWSVGDRNPVAANDRVRVTPLGPDALEPVVVEVAALVASASASGVSGTATFAGEALAGDVSLRSSAGATSAAAITNIQTGAFVASVSPDGTTLTWARGVPRGIVATLSATGPEPLRPEGGNGPATPAPGSSTVPGVTSSGACTLKPALRKKYVPKRGTTAKVVRACLGKPNRIRVIKKTKAQVWTYTKRKLAITIRKSKVQAIARIKVAPKRKPVTKKAPVKATKERRDTAPAALRPALALVGVSAQEIGYRLLVAAPRADLRAQVDHGARTITVFLDPAEAPHLVAHDIAHEIGHAVDHVRLSDADRRAYLARRGVADAPWWPSAADDATSGAGDFAEVFALCHAASPDFRSRLAARPERACSLLPTHRSQR